MGLRHAIPTSFGQSRGNPRGEKGRGSDPATLRYKMRNALARQIDALVAIASGEPVHKVKGPDGVTVIGTVSATPADRLKAIDTLAKYGIGTTQAVDITSGGQPLLEAGARRARVLAILSASAITEMTSAHGEVSDVPEPLSLSSGDD